MKKDAVKKQKNCFNLDRVRTDLSIRRTKMSCERSLLSYISTACVFVSLAFTYLKIAVNDVFDPFVVIMFCIGGFFLAFGLIEYFLVKFRLKNLYKGYMIECADEDLSAED